MQNNPVRVAVIGCGRIAGHRRVMSGFGLENDCVALGGKVAREAGQRRRQPRACIAADDGNAGKDGRGDSFGHGHD